MVDNPAALRSERVNIVDELRPWHPVGSMKERVDLDVGQIEPLCECTGERRLARAAASGDENALHRLMARVVPGAAEADGDVHGDLAERVGAGHLAAYQLLDRVALPRRNLEHELVVHL